MDETYLAAMYPSYQSPFTSFESDFLRSPADPLDFFGYALHL